MTAAAATPSDSARLAAIEWQLCLSGGSATDADRQAFDIWLAASPLHGAAWQHLNAALGNALRVIDPKLLTAAGPLRRSLLRPQDTQRRRLNKLLLASGALLAGGAWLDRQIPLRHIAADYVTGTGQRRRILLPDGSVMELDARSAASADFSMGKRLVRLETGAAIFELAGSAATPAPAVNLPLRVLTAEGEVLLNAGRALVQCESGKSLCVALVGDAEIITRQGQSRGLAAGQGAWFDTRQIDATQEAQAHAAAWQEGQIEVHNEPLQRVADALSRYRPGWIRVSPAASRLRVSGLFPLDNTDRALEALRHTQPITLRRFGALYVMIDVSAPQA